MTGELAAITGPGTAFFAGLVTSLHCAGMCGPLACAIMPAAKDNSDPQVVASVYHITRLAGYTALGALATGETAADAIAFAATMADPLGTLYRFSLPTSLLRRSHVATEESR